MQCWGSHQIIGTLGPTATISLKTDKGRVDISAREIATLWLIQRKIGLGHSSDLGYQQQEAVIGALIRMKMDNPDIGSDTLSDAIMNISHKRVLPAFFAMLEKHRNNRNLQRQASYSIWILFGRWFPQETPKEIDDMRDLNRDPMRSGEIWRRWYKVNRERLVWDEHSLRYYLKKRIAEQDAPADADKPRR